MRNDKDNYPTELALVKPLLDIGLLSGMILEPCAGNGNIAEALRDSGLYVITNDIDDSYECFLNYDATDPTMWIDEGPFDWVVTNPPYTAEDLYWILNYALDYSKRGVAMLLRLTANEPVIKRGSRGLLLRYYADNLRYLMTFSAPRPSFTGDGKTDSVTTAWYVWDKKFSWKSKGMKSPFQYIVNWRNENV